mgnify:CR=1 FL=1
MLVRNSVYFAYVRLHFQGLGWILAILHIDIIICYTYSNINRTPRTSQRCAPGETFFIRRYYWRNNIKWSSGLGNSIFIACICFVISVLCSHMISCFFHILHFSLLKFSFQLHDYTRSRGNSNSADVPKMRGGDWG